MLSKIISTLLILVSVASAQVVIGGQATGGGQTVISNLGPVTPPPPVGLTARLFGGVYNSSVPSWPPKDINGGLFQQGLCRIWDSGAKINQIMFASGPVGAHTYSFNWNPLDSLIERCKGTNGFTGAAQGSLKVMYTLGSTPCGAAVGPVGTFPLGTPPCNVTGLGVCPTSGATSDTCLCATPDVAYSCAAYDDNVVGGSTETDKTMITFVATLFQHLTSLGITLDGIEIQNEWDTNLFQCWSGPSCGSGTNPLSANNITAVMNKAMVQRGHDIQALRNCLSPTTQIYSPSSHVASVQPGSILDNLINTSITVHALTHGQNGYPSTCPDIPSQTVLGWQVFDVINWHPDGQVDTPESLISSDALLECERTTGCKSTGGISHSGNAYLNLIGMPKTGDEFGPRSDTCATAGCLQGDVMRRFIYCGFLGYQECAWYQVDSKSEFQSLVCPTNGGTCSTGGVALDALVPWLMGAVLTPFTSPTGTVYQETFANSHGVNEILAYDTGATDTNNGYTCNYTIGGTGCTTVTVPVGYTKYESIDGVVHAVNGSHQIAVGGIPVCVTTNTSGC